MCFSYFPFKGLEKDYIDTFKAWKETWNTGPKQAEARWTGHRETESRQTGSRQTGRIQKGPDRQTDRQTTDTQTLAVLTTFCIALFILFYSFV